jgi:hypothetical protein
MLVMPLFADSEEKISSDQLLEAIHSILQPDDFNN